MDTPEIKALLDRYLEGSASPAEQELIEQWLEETWNSPNDWDSKSHADKAAWLASLYQDLLEEIRQRPSQPANESSGPPVIPTGGRRRRFLLQVAAMVVLLAGGAKYYLAQQKGLGRSATVLKPRSSREQQGVLPGSSKAVLTLDDGRTITLDSANNGLLVKQGNTAVSNTGESLLYKGSPDGNRDIAYNTLATPRGGQYQLMLSDGSRVWLNAASSIRYPTAFSGGERKVEITGEAYFEVASLPNPARTNEKWPFRVIINTAEHNNNRASIEVLGTHFNINAYDDEPAINATLLEGSIRMTAVAPSTGAQNITQQLAPGQEAVLDKDGGIKVHPGDMEAAVAWKEGVFLMNKADIGAVLRQLARWYDVEVVYKSGSPGGHISGDIPRTMNLADVLKVMQLSGISLSLEGKKIIVDGHANQQPI